MSLPAQVFPEPDDSQDDDPELAAEVERAVGPYKHLVPPDVLQTMRETLAEMLASHPVGAVLMDQSRQPTHHDPSGTRLKGSRS
ncbi:MAG: hypothetical protein ABI134_28665 [Byssovorax sp.]